MRGPLLLTGATGFVGMELLARYLERTDRRVFALIRAGDDLEARARLRATLERIGVSDRGGRVVAVRGDVTLPRLGLDSRAWRALAAETSEIVHAAASVSFTLGLAESRAINVTGTRRMLQFAEACALDGGLERFSYVSTAYVAGTHRGTFGEDDLDVGQRFRNAYEQSKFEAEALVRRHMARLPIQVFRPSIVVGEEDTGWTPAFNVIYWPMKAFSRGAYAALPARPAAPVDVVSISYVADAIFALAGCEGGAGETYALAAGPLASTVGELLGLSARAFERRSPRTVPQGLYRRTVHPVLLARADERRRATLRASEVFFPYFAMRQRFDTGRVAARLDGLSVAPAPLEEYFGRLVDYAVLAEWGRRELPRRPAAAPALAVA
ncbi:MAG: Male sterility domain protein [Solirubrobacterales bacterium]|nr:Male sterility domain protein [Solirubrobacterales bacterium]